MLYQPVSQWHSLHFELFIELVAQKLTELWRFKNLAYFFTWWPSSMTYLFVNVTYWNCSPIPCVDQVWWWYVKAFMSYAWQNWQTNRQTDRQTNRQTNILAKNCKFWQVTNRQTNILAKNCKFWQVTNWQTNILANFFEILASNKEACKHDIRLSYSISQKYAHGFVVLCFVVVIQSFIMNSHEVFIHIHQGCFAGTGAIVRLPQCQWSKPDGYGEISQCITTTKHSTAKTLCIYLEINCI